MVLIRAMLDNGYENGGLEGKFKSSVELVIDSTTTTETNPTLTNSPSAANTQTIEAKISLNVNKSPGVNWKTIGWGVTEFISGFTALGRAAAISYATGGIGTIPSAWLASSGVMSMGIGIIDIMLGIYGHPTAAEFIGNDLKNNAIGTRFRQFTPEFMP